MSCPTSHLLQSPPEKRATAYIERVNSAWFKRITYLVSYTCCNNAGPSFIKNLPCVQGNVCGV